MGHISYAAASLDQAMLLLNQVGVDLVFLDVNLPDGNGLTALPLIKQSPSELEVIIITVVGSSAGAELAIKHGQCINPGGNRDRQRIVCQSHS